MKKRKVYVPPLRSHALRYRSVSFGSDNTVYEVRSCRRSPIFCSYLAKHLIYRNVVRHIFQYFFSNKEFCWRIL